ncbi:MAG: metallophosphoesterase [Bacteroidales bacterium]|nr:metallophosphoesterase [Bacteroidales bacterium]
MHFIFFFLILGLYIASCVYIARRMCKATSNKKARIAIIVTISLLTLSFFLQRIIGASAPEWVNRAMYMASTMWLVVVLYTMVMLLVFGIARLIAKKKNGEVPPETPASWWRIAAIVGIVIVSGIINAYTPKLTHYTLHSDKMPNGDTLRVALVSDIHLGYAVRKGDAERLTKMVNAQHPDLCIIAGDLLDGDISTVVANDLVSPLNDITATRGTYAVLGNHEYMADATKADEYLSKQKLTLLRDSAVTVTTNSFNLPPYIRIIGREDLSKERMGGRKPLSEMTCDTCTYTIVIDHQPGAIDESEECEADLHLSGHTHAGQVWPMRMFTKMTYEVDYGYARKGKTDIIVTSGFGTWGPRMRIGNTPEVVVIDITR